MSLKSKNPLWLQSPGRWLILALAGAAACAGAYFLWPQVVMRAHLLAVGLWTGISIGALLLLMLHRLVGGQWGVLLKPSLVAAVQPFWLLALIFVPVLLQLKSIYPWANWDRSALPEHHVAKASYLEPSMYLARAAIYWALWIVGAWILTRAAHNDNKRSAWADRLSALGLPMLVVSVTFAAVDWWMSLEPEWSTSSYGLLILAGQGAAALALSILIAALAPESSVAIHDTHSHEAHEAISPWRDVGNLLLASLCLWMYVTFMQFLIIWTGNLPEEATWYLVRSRGAWRAVIVVLVLFHFAVPFMLLLSRSVKEVPKRLAAIGALVLLMHLLEGLWLVAPAFQPDWRLIAVSMLAVVTVGAAWFFLFVLQWRRELTLARSDHA